MLAWRGLRVTRQRELIFDALRATRSHPTAEELLEAVRPHEPGMSLATVYNTLDALAEAGLCRRVPTPTGASRFDADMRPHVHAVTGEGRLIDIPEELCRRILDRAGWMNELEAVLGVRVTDLQVHVESTRAGSTSPLPGPISG